VRDARPPAAARGDDSVARPGGGAHGPVGVRQLASGGSGDGRDGGGAARIGGFVSAPAGRASRLRLCAVLLAVALSACATAPDPADRVEILWDTWGVPHVFAPDDEGLYYGLGWVQMSAHAPVM